MQRRVAETGFGLLAAGIGLAVLAGSLRHDTGWGPTGPGAGYFPLRVGGLLAALGLIQAARSVARGEAGLLLHAGAARRVLGLFLPTVAFGLAMPVLGTYLPMALYLLWMGRIGQQGWGPSLALALLAPPAFWLIFETWLMVPLAKGPLEEWLGLW
jgi:putative tricarboxylic transport membrane protein